MSSSPDLNGNAKLRSMKDRLDKDMAGRSGGTEENRPTIFRVPAHIRDEDGRAYDPKAISIGPYHRGKERLKSTEDLKWLYLRRFFGRNPDRRLEDHYEEMKKLETRARSCYSEPIELDSDEFAEMLILDGCFIIEFLHTLDSGPPNIEEFRSMDDPVTRTGWSSIIPMDMILLENQLPFFVLRSLYNDDDTRLPLSQLVLSFLVTFQYMSNIRSTPDIVEVDIHHILHIYHSCIKPPFEQLLQTATNPIPDSAQTWFPNATQLNEAGIEFRRKEGLAPLLAKFSNGVIEMQLLSVDDSTIPILRNFIAFEQCYPVSVTYVTSYASFLDNLVDKHTDIALLQQQGVLLNHLGSEEEVACMINKLCKNIFLYSDSHLEQLILDVNKYHNSRWPRWRAKLARDYFSNPWSIISLIAALILLSLAIVQTVFSVLSYVHPKPA